MVCITDLPSALLAEVGGDQVAKSPKLAQLKPLIRSFLISLLHFLSHVSVLTFCCLIDAQASEADNILKQLLVFQKLLIPFPKVAKYYLKVVSYQTLQIARKLSCL